MLTSLQSTKCAINKRTKYRNILASNTELNAKKVEPEMREILPKKNSPFLISIRGINIGHQNSFQSSLFTSSCWVSNIRMRFNELHEGSDARKTSRIVEFAASQQSKTCEADQDLSAISNDCQRTACN